MLAGTPPAPGRIGGGCAVKLCQPVVHVIAPLGTFLRRMLVAMIQLDPFRRGVYPPPTGRVAFSVDRPVDPFDILLNLILRPSLALGNLGKSQALAHVQIIRRGRTVKHLGADGTQKVQFTMPGGGII